MEKDEYIKWNSEVYCLLLRCYVDVAILEEVEHYHADASERRKGMIKASYDVVGHICEAIRCDLVLSLWKVYYDLDRSSRSLPNLRAAFRKYTRENSLYITVKKRRRTPFAVEVGDELCHMREIYITEAVAPEFDEIFLNKIKKILEIIRAQFNEICRPEIDEALIPINKAVLEKQRFHTSLGLSWLVGNSMVDWDK